jgi:hypothetical protein
MRHYFSTAFQHKIIERSQKTKPPFQQKSRDPCLASLYAYNKAAAAFEKSGFISARPFNAKQLRGHKKQSRSINKKSRDPNQASLCACSKAAAAFKKSPALFQHGLSSQNNEEVTKNKAAL